MTKVASSYTPETHLDIKNWQLGQVQMGEGLTCLLGGLPELAPGDQVDYLVVLGCQHGQGLGDVFRDPRWVLGEG